MYSIIWNSKPRVNTGPGLVAQCGILLFTFQGSAQLSSTVNGGQGTESDELGLELCDNVDE